MYQFYLILRLFFTLQVIYLPGPGNEEQNNHHDNSRQTDLTNHDRQLRNNLTMNLPPSIPISLDGEGYDRCYPYLTSALGQRVESVCPPPNRTIFDGESPPAYRSHSVGKLDRPSSRSSAAAMLASSRGSNRDCSESPRVERCYSMSNNNKPGTGGSGGGAVNALSYDHHLPRRTRHSTGHSPHVAPSTAAHMANSLLDDQPPGYDEVILADYHCVDRRSPGGTQL